ncbi:MAG: hypothetical protein CVV25_14040 [Ignavibacteriae bacterium HGW-Ignavibacteriae-4]|jgi:uncharacterized membrane protein|nr:MAG: hypothetical protein CVV25_14040 [Ignavibacteriae bacterium HGW-Ignavibacteriae-4]
MSILSSILLVLHVVFGGSALVLGLFSTSSQKGKKLHKKSGFYFFISMLIVSITAIVLSSIKGSTFLFHIGIFSLYMNYSGLRAIRNKKLTPSTSDWIVNIASLINTILMIASFELVLVIFGLISLQLVYSQLRLFYFHIRNKEIPRMTWLVQHIGMMVGTYISTFTAFLVVNVNFISPAWIVWILPTVIFTPMIFYWTRKSTAQPKIKTI